MKTISEKWLHCCHIRIELRGILSFVYITSDGSVIGINGGHIRIKYSDNTEEFIPKETVDGISIFGKSHLTSACIQYCLENHIRVSYFSRSGRFIGQLTPTYKTRIYRLKKQIELTTNEDFCLEFSKAIIYAKINNQYVVAKRYLRDKGYDTKDLLFPIRNSRRRIKEVNSINQLRGYEGIASKNYFEIISLIIKEEFKFQKRQKRPPRDPFNSMLSFGYSLLMKEIYGELENRGICAFAGFMHTESSYLSYIEKPVTFRKAIWHQCEKLGRAIDYGDASLYQPIIIR